MGSWIYWTLTQLVTRPNKSLLHTGQCSQSRCSVTASNGGHSSPSRLTSSQAATFSRQPHTVTADGRLSTETECIQSQSNFTYGGLLPISSTCWSSLYSLGTERTENGTDRTENTASNSSYIVASRLVA
jgi:hypothetical protein